MANEALQISIYQVCDPETKAVVYVGQSRNPEARLSQHLRMRSPLSDWLIKKMAAGIVVKLEVVAIVGTQTDADDAEKNLIKGMIRDGQPLLNVKHAKAPVASGGIRITDPYVISLVEEEQRRSGESTPRETAQRLIVERLAQKDLAKGKTYKQTA